MVEADSSRQITPGGELPLSNQGQLELLRAMTERGLPLRTRVRGFSMAPWIRDDDVVTIDPMDSRGPSLGDVVAFVIPESGRLALHRVTARGEAGWILRGDSCLEADGVVAVDQMLGRVVRVERNGRDAHFGRGARGAAIAWASQRGGLVILHELVITPRRLASSILRFLQRLRPYRAIGRRVFPGAEISEANETDLAGLLRWFNVTDIEVQPPPLDVCARYWVARRKEKVVGFAELVPIQEPQSPWVGHWLFSLMVRRRYRGLGIGEALTRRVIAEARAQGAAELLLAVFDDNKVAIDLYRKLSFREGAVDALEPAFEEEKRASGRRRVVMHRAL